MKRASAAAVALLCAACGSSSDAPQAPTGATPGASATAGHENGAPTIDSAVIRPNPAGAADGLALEIHARDPEQDRLRTTIEWYRNGELVGDQHETSVPANTFARGDRVYAIVYVADAAHEVSQQTATVVLGNSAPKIRGVEITPVKPTSGDMLEAKPTLEDADGDPIETSYRWHKNGDLIPAATSSRLGVGTLRRGDKVYVEASASDGTDASDWIASRVVEIGNAPPAITSQPGYEMGPTGVYSYDISAKDPDDDQPLRYELVTGPKGMVVDESTGKLAWTVPQDAHGNSPVEVAVSDAYGGRVTQSWVLSVDWNQAPAAPSQENGEEGVKKSASAKDKAAKSESGESDEEATPKKKAAPAAPAPKANAEAAAKKKSKAAEADGDQQPEMDEGEPATNED